MTAIAATYLGEARTYAEGLYQGAKKYVGYVAPKASEVYKWENKAGQEVVLDGKAKQAAMDYTALERKKTQYERITHVVAGALGTVLYHKAWWQHNPLESLVVIPLYFAHKHVISAIRGHFQVQLDAKTAEVAEALCKKA